MRKQLIISYFSFIFIFLEAHSFQNDSINKWIKNSQNRELGIIQRKEFLLKSYSYIKNNNLKLPNELSNIAFEFYKLKDSLYFFKINKEALELGLKSNDLYSIADTNWNFATYFIKEQHYGEAYFHLNKACEKFLEINHKKEATQILQGMAKIKGRFRDYAGSEVLNIKAIELFKELKDYKNLYRSYNLLAILQRDLKEYDKAIEYFNRALDYFEKLPSETKKDSYIEIFNNIGITYFDKEQYEKALEFYKKEISNRNLKRDQYARVLDNLAYCKLKMQDTIGIKNDFFESLRIRDSLNNKTDITSSKIRISEYFLFLKDSLKALKYAKEANSLAKEIKNGGDYLTTLQQLANLDTKNSKQYLDRYIQFNDSLINEERRVQNKFTRIEFETDEYIEETERLSQQRIWIIVTSIGGILILSLLYFLRVQKVKNEKLSIEAEHQKANEEVYILTLQQQARVEEERIKERNRISEELHDGILGKLFGTRFGLGFLPLEGDDETLEKHQNLLDELQDIEKEIRDVSHKLSDNFNSSDVNFTSIIKQLLEDKGIIGKFTHDVHFAPDISWKDIDEITKANVYRIIQEALQNIIKHAKASHVSIHFNVENNNLIIRIQDNGVGFDIKKGKKGIGIKNIKSRIEKLKGSIKIESEINVGTTLHINTPYIQQDAN